MQKRVDDYASFLAGKAVTAPPCGFEPVEALMPTAMKDFQRDITTWACRRGRAAVFAGTGLGKALDVATPVLTPTGYRPLSTVCVGDLVIGGDGKPTRVVGVFPQGVRPAFEVKFSCGSSVVCDQEHLWTVRTKRDKHSGKPWVTHTLKHMMNAGIVYEGEDRHSRRWFIPMVEPVELVGGDLPLHPYVLGALIGDGSFRNGSVGFTSADPEIVDFINDNLPFGYGLIKRQYTKYDYRLGRIVDGKDGRRGGHWSNDVHDTIDELGLAHLLSSEKFIPDNFKFADLEARTFLMQGLLDTDGSVWMATGKSPVIEYCTTSRQLAEDFLFLVQSLGGTGKIHTKQTNCKPAYRVHPNFPIGTKPFLLSRKAEKWKDREKHQPTRSIRMVTQVDDREMACIKVENEDGLFVVNDCIVTHNTLIELTWAQQVVEKTQGRVLLFTPLAVAEQTVQEAAKFGIRGVSYAPDGNAISTVITVTNYDRRDKFDLDDFAGIICDESGILKSHESKTRLELTAAVRDTPYLLCGSATPAPNDWTELGQHSEFLGVMSAKEMLAMFFVHEGSVRADATKEDWRLKGHAQDEFWRWVASWAVMIRHPRDLGYGEPGYDLPPLNVEQITVKVDWEPSDGELFAREAQTLQERQGARRNSIAERVDAASKLIAAKPFEPWLIWCGLNDEADAIVQAVPGTVNVEGKNSTEFKIANLLGFCKGEPLRLATKGKIAGRGMNWQHCRNMIYLGLNDSFEQLFQGIRRCWRFGQVGTVNVYLIASELEGAVVKNLQAKERKYEAMAEAMAGHMKELTRTAVRGGRISTTAYEPKQTMRLPKWL